MPRINRAIAACAAIAATTAAFAMPASGAELEGTIDPNPCVADPNLPTCVNYGFDVAERTIITTRSTWNEEVVPAIKDPACTVYELLSEPSCPDRFLEL
ncbi:MAG TPA: hypothetical protein VF587_18470 [Solirubrobacteraceae bacterium]|jgi:hypothetical protein